MSFGFNGESLRAGRAGETDRAAHVICRWALCLKARSERLLNTVKVLCLVLRQRLGRLGTPGRTSAVCRQTRLDAFQPEQLLVSYYCIFLRQALHASLT